MTMEDGVLTVKMKYDDGFYETVLMKDFGFTRSDSYNSGGWETWATILPAGTL